MENFFTIEEQQKIIEAIHFAEFETSGEIRVHIDGKCSEKTALDAAVKVFSELKMQKTALRNGVLFYLAVKDKKFAVVGDVGINRLVDTTFWDSTKEFVLNYFKKGDFVNGLVEGVKMAGVQLKVHFPYQKDTDTNELSNEISFGKK